MHQIYGKIVTALSLKDGYFKCLKVLIYLFSSAAKFSSSNKLFLILNVFSWHIVRNCPTNDVTCIWYKCFSLKCNISKNASVKLAITFYLGHW